MKAHIRYLGVVDRSGVTHAVPFGPGVNVVTGKSSTGKSALIEIFDFCFGSSEFTVPEGIITERAAIYFCILSLKNTNLILARRREEAKAYLREAVELKLAEPLNLPADFFDPALFLNLDDFKKELGRYLGLLVTNPEENSTNKAWKGNRKAGAPSIRSLTSLMLQHQNLIANKHAIFYRFDEREKRDQVIEHFKIFVGFADQVYFNQSQKLNELAAEQRKIEILIPKAEEVRKQAGAQFNQAMIEYQAISGEKLDLGTTDGVVRNPGRALAKLRDVKVSVISVSDEHVKQKDAIQMRTTELTAKLRQQHNKLAEIRSSMAFAAQYSKENAGTPLPAETIIQASRCPFCRSEHSAIEQEANKLLGAIDWLNRELESSPYLLESFLEAEQKVGREVESLQDEIRQNESLTSAIDFQTKELEKYKSQFELSLRAKYRLESILGELVGGRNVELEKQLETIKGEITTIRHFLKTNYDMEAKLAVAENTIREFMVTIGQHFEFEASYRPIRLSFSLSNFELWHNSAERKILLRSMGSGANWLYSHITLFLSLHRYFCSLGDRCSVPSILFLDQPSQVYFPSALDTSNAFDASKLAEKEGEARKRPVDDDLVAVSNLYDQLIAFCKETETATGIMPQVIVTDHADNLVLKDCQSFENLVQGRRWRTRGFIDETVKVSTPAAASQGTISGGSV